MPLSDVAGVNGVVILLVLPPERVRKPLLPQEEVFCVKEGAGLKIKLKRKVCLIIIQSTLPAANRRQCGLLRPSLTLFVVTLDLVSVTHFKCCLVQLHETVFFLPENTVR